MAIWYLDPFCSGSSPKAYEHCPAQAEDFPIPCSAVRRRKLELELRMANGLKMMFYLVASAVKALNPEPSVLV